MTATGITAPALRPSRALRRYLAARHRRVHRRRGPRRAAVSIGPQYGTVGREQVREAAGETRHLGRLTVLTARMNPDLLMDKELLKETGAGNLFMVFGEPNMKLEQEEDGRLRMKLLGLDLYDHTTGSAEHRSTLRLRRRGAPAPRRLSHFTSLY